MVIRAVVSGSKAEALRIQPGEKLLSINGHAIRDLLDYHFYVADGGVEIVVQSRTGERRTLSASLDPGEDLGLEIGAIRTRRCGNDCIFCFIDQNPRGMRDAVYVKDEDYRLSFLHGNFVTLTNIGRWELERIVQQRLSPLYISVHSTEASTRRRLLRPRSGGDILEQIDFLAKHGIVMHTQVVLCPGYNDSDDLERTIGELSERWPSVRSLAVVPVGLTEHREGLTPLSPVTCEDARHLLERVRIHAKRFREHLGVGFVYASDEIYCLAGSPLPPAAQYDGFPQIENGVGMARRFLDRLSKRRRLFLNPTRAGYQTVTLVTGELFEPILRSAISDWCTRTAEDVEIRIIACENRFFGRCVTVAGLLTASDIAHGLEGHDLGDRVFLPSEVLNQDGLFLDDQSPDELARQLGVPVHVGFGWT